ncbi:MULTISPECIES: ABC transporter ATP-binding protein [Paraburkholderia]|uniref:ABC transporter ATP-binding protein n=1 Tax=Paraburkholderia TaxID=1822464 RepID=UPI00035DA4EE|nr:MULTISPECIES: ABC transporter ATP-binding protein [Paraburkholderia]MDH6153646.1 peptide/nickel transport system ATP-binding protein [Paraburkholderia sp. WSM4179]
MSKITEQVAARPLYEIEGLVIDLYTEQRTIRAVDECSLSIRPGETLAIVGESGSGKTVMTLGPLGLLPEGIAVQMRGKAKTARGDLLHASGKTLVKIRGNEFGVVFQDPLSALNPMRRIGPQLAEQARRFAGLSADDAKADAIANLGRVGIADPADRYWRYPHEFSGGMRQRAMIALALSSRPKILLADEPTTALDATVQAQILALLKRIQAEDGLAIILITHDIGVVAGMADRVAVMYAGRIVEQGAVVDVLKHPIHPYTQGLLSSVPDLDTPVGERLTEIPGAPPDLSHLERGCRFASRCFAAKPSCNLTRPALVPVSSQPVTHKVACLVMHANGQGI